MLCGELAYCRGSVVLEPEDPDLEGIYFNGFSFIPFLQKIVFKNGSVREAKCPFHSLYRQKHCYATSNRLCSLNILNTFNLIVIILIDFIIIGSRTSEC